MVVIVTLVDLAPSFVMVVEEKFLNNNNFFFLEPASAGLQLELGGRRREFLV